MKTVVITESFTGYPNGKERSFTAGEEVEVANEFGDLIITKGHAREVAPGKSVVDTPNGDAE